MIDLSFSLYTAMESNSKRDGESGDRERRNKKKNGQED